ncbi:MAG: NAD(P)H-binding protein [Trebonia sp.]
MPAVLAEAARAGVRKVVQLSGMSAGSGDMSNAITAYMATSEQAARESGLDWAIVRPAEFMTNAFRWAPRLRAGNVVRDPFGHVRTAVTDPADIAAVAAPALTSAGHESRVYEVSGPESRTPAERIAILGRVLGRELRFEALSNEEARAEMSATTPARYVDAFFGFYVGGTLDESRVLPTVPELLGRPAGTFAQWTAAHAHAF